MSAIIPVFTTPYLIIWALPWLIPLVLISEGIIFWRYYPAMKRWLLFAGTVGANAFSWMVGIFLVGFLPRGYSIDPATNEISYVHVYIVLSFIIALVLAILLEYLVWRLIFWKQPLPSLGRVNTVANIVSYAILVVCGVIVALA